MALGNNYFGRMPFLPPPVTLMGTSGNWIRVRWVQVRCQPLSHDCEKRNKDLTKKNQTRNRAIDNQTGLVSMTELCTRVPVYNGQKRGRAHEFLDRVK